MAYKYHPEINGLKINEDGTIIILDGRELQVKAAKRENRENPIKHVHFFRRTHSVAKLVCECWNGMAENPRWVATRKDKEEGLHYTNLYFKPRGFNPASKQGKVKRSSRSKLSKEDVKVIQKRIDKGDTLKSIATDYRTSDMSISRIKKRMKNGKKSI